MQKKVQKSANVAKNIYSQIHKMSETYTKVYEMTSTKNEHSSPSRQKSKCREKKPHYSNFSSHITSRFNIYKMNKKQKKEEGGDGEKLSPPPPYNHRREEEER